ncbi:unnamed protein product, partial [Musa textilis]
CRRTGLPPSSLLWGWGKAQIFPGWFRTRVSSPELSKQVQLKWLFEVSVNREICVVILTVFKGLYDFGQER